jgi:hypothetical protein
MVVINVSKSPHEYVFYANGGFIIVYQNPSKYLLESSISLMSHINILLNNNGP